MLQRKCTCGGTPGPTGECAECRRKRTLGLQTKLAVNTPGDRYEQEADHVAEQVMRMNVGDATPPISIQRLAPGALQRQDGEEEAPDPITEGLGTVGENLGENNPEFTDLAERLADDFLRQPAALSVGVPVFLGTNYAFLWGMALANPAMRQHLNDFNFGTLPGIIPQFPIKTFTYRILNEEQTQFEFDLGLDVSALLEVFNEGVINTHLSTLSLETSGGLDTEAASPVSLSSLQVNLGLFDDGLMLSGGFRSGVSPYPLLEHDDLTGERFRIMEQVPALPDLYPDQQDVRFLLQVDFMRLYHHFNPDTPPIRSVPQEVEGDRPLSRKHTAPGPTTAPPVVDAVLAMPGQALDTGTRQFMEQRFGHDFGQVRIHVDDRAAASAAEVQARAYTVGSQVVFGQGQYAPGTAAGRRLLAHELTHVVQQEGMRSPSASTLVQREQAPTLGAGNLLFESAPEFPGCSPYERFRLDYQLLRARNMVRIAEADVGRELARTDRTTGIITLIGSAISQYFHTTEERHIRTLLTRLGRIAERLERGPRNWRCIAHCASKCGKEVLACAGPTVPVYLCPTHFEQGDTAGALTLVHEAAHQAGLGLPTPQGYRTDIYEGERRLPTLTTTQALNTPDAYKALVRDNRYGGPLPPSQAWTPKKTIIGDIHDPHLKDLVGWSDGRRLRIPPSSAVENRFRGVFVYDEPAGRPGWFDDLPDPEVSLRIVLRRSGNDRDRRGRPRESVLFDQRGSAAPNQFGRINPPGTENGFEFDLAFDKADRGTLHTTAQVRDEGLGMTVTYTDQVPVRPTAAPELVGTPTGTPGAPETEAPQAPPLQIQRLAAAPGPATAPPSVEASLATPGQALDTGTRQFMEQRFGHDFGRVRIHADTQAAASAAEVQALAYTVGSDVVFGQGQYMPGTAAGRRLLAHELTHVVQQDANSPHLQRQDIPEPTLTSSGDTRRVSPPDGVPVTHGVLHWDFNYRGEAGTTQTNPEGNLVFTQGKDVEISVTFTPNAGAGGCPTVTFLQTVIPTTGGLPDAGHLLFTRDPASGASVDVLDTESEPYYGAGPSTAGPGLVPEHSATHGGTTHPGDSATFHDAPIWSTGRIPPGQTAVREFEVAAICVETGATFGSLRWGYTKTSAGVITLTGGTTADVSTSGASAGLELVRQAFYQGYFQHSLHSFARGSTSLTAAHRTALDALAPGLKGQKVRRILLVGNNDFSGGAEARTARSLERAEAVRDYLIAQGVPAGKIEVQGHGVTARIPNPSGRSVPENRRVDVHLDFGETGLTQAAMGSPNEEFRMRRTDPRLLVNELIELMIDLQTRRGRLPFADCNQMNNLLFYIDRWRHSDPTVPDVRTIYSTRISALRARCTPQFEIPRPEFPDLGPMLNLDDLAPDPIRRIEESVENPPF
jgi:hypothetical protein